MNINIKHIYNKVETIKVFYQCHCFASLGYVLLSSVELFLVWDDMTTIAISSCIQADH